VTVWAMLGSFDWNCLVTAMHGYYEAGPFDVRSPQPRETALAHMMRELSAGKPVSHPALAGSGWWRRPGRFFCEPVVTRHAVITHRAPEPAAGPPILVIGATGTLGQAFARLCGERDLHYVLLGRQQLDMADAASVERAVAQYRPWAIVNAAGYVRVDDAERDSERCFRENTLGPHVLADACSRHGIQLLTYSSDLVFDGAHDAPYLESHAPGPLNIYGRSKAEAERLVMERHPEALMIRTSAFFGPWDKYNFITQALSTLAQDKPFRAANDLVITPTYVLDLVNASLDLLIDRERGIWHLTNGHALTWEQLALKAADAAGIDPSRLESCRHTELSFAARRPVFSALGSERGMILPSLDKAIAHYVSMRPFAPDPSVRYA
jgi:dTDP-4-dehydrorhamnose reductase